MDTMTFPSPGPVRFEIEIGAGEVQVTASDRADTTVEIDVRKGPEPEVTHRDGPDGTTITIRAKKARRQDYGDLHRVPRGDLLRDHHRLGRHDRQGRGRIDRVPRRVGRPDLPGHARRRGRQGRQRRRDREVRRRIVHDAQRLGRRAAAAGGTRRHRQDRLGRHLDRPRRGRRERHDRLGRRRGRVAPRPARRTCAACPATSRSAWPPGRRCSSICPRPRVRLARTWRRPRARPARARTSSCTWPPCPATSASGAPETGSMRAAPARSRLPVPPRRPDALGVRRLRDVPGARDLGQGAHRIERGGGAHDPPVRPPGARRARARRDRRPVPAPPRDDRDRPARGGGRPRAARGRRAGRHVDPLQRVLRDGRDRRRLPVRPGGTAARAAGRRPARRSERRVAVHGAGDAAVRAADGRRVVRRVRRPGGRRPRRRHVPRQRRAPRRDPRPRPRAPAGPRAVVARDPGRAAPHRRSRRTPPADRRHGVHAVAVRLGRGDDLRARRSGAATGPSRSSACSSTLQGVGVDRGRSHRGGRAREVRRAPHRRDRRRGRGRRHDRRSGRRGCPW